MGPVAGPLAAPRSTASKLEELGNFWVTKILLVSAELNVHGRLARGAATAAGLAADLRLDPRAAEYFLDALVALGLLQKRAGRYWNSRAGRRFLVPGAREYVGHILIASNRDWAAWGRLEEALRTGEAQRARSVFDDPGHARDLLLSIHRRALRVVRGVVAALPWRDRRQILDLGGGAGTFGVAFARAWPGTRVTLLDLPAGLSVAREVVPARLLESGRIRLAECDFTRDPIPGRYDAIFLSNIIHARSPEENRSLLRDLRRSLEPGGQVAVRDYIMDESRTRPVRGAVFALQMLIHTGIGRTYTYREVREWLRAAGYTRVKRVGYRGDDHAIVLGTAR